MTPLKSNTSFGSANSQSLDESLMVRSFSISEACSHAMTLHFFGR
jgi:hypothetical protein